MTILDENPIPQLVARHRKLKERRDSLDEQIKDVKEELRPAIEANGGKWQDQTGYARMVTRKDSVGFPSAAVNGFAESWSESDDPIMKSCGDMLLRVRQEKSGFSYLQVK